MSLETVRIVMGYRKNSWGKTMRSNISGLHLIEEKFDELVNWVEPARVYHYTDFDCMSEIIKTKTVRATHRGYLNDGAELKYGLQKCMDVLDAWSDGKPEDLKELCAKIKAKIGLDDPSESPFSYSACFSEVADGAAPWQVYGHYGQGVAIGFDFSSLQSALRDAECFDCSEPESSGEITAAHFFLAKMEYDRENQDSQIQQLLDTGLEALPKAREWFKCNPDGHFVHCLANRLAMLALRTFKHPGHVFEREWRALPHISSDELVQYQIGKRGIRPYIPMNFKLDAIVEIVVGGAVRDPFIERTLKSYLRTLGLSDVHIHRSGVELVPPLG